MRPSLMRRLAIAGMVMIQTTMLVAQDTGTTVASDPKPAPNVLFIAMDDLNDWIGPLGGHPQAKTPNLDRLAAGGMLFDNAHCAAPACNPSRSAIFTGRAPNVSGLYDNRQNMREVMPGEVLIPQYFRNHGYRASGSGKMLHYFIDGDSWDEYFPRKDGENPLPDSIDPAERPASLPRGGPWQYVETDWAPVPVEDEDFGGDYLVSRWIGDKLAQSHEQPFFLACGIYRPHEPWFVPQKYFDAFPLDSIQLPPGYKADDLDDVPDEGRLSGQRRYFEHIQKQGQWRQGVRGYLASIYFADAMLGHVLDQLERGPNADNTIVVLWSDHGWHLGSKERWQKYSAWRAVTRIPLIVRVPSGASTRLPAGTRAGAVCDAPVNLLSLYPTLTDLCGLPPNPVCDGPSLVPLLSDPKSDWPHVSTTFLAKPGSIGVSSRAHRYIRYASGGEELYDTHNDRYEWNNVAGDPAFSEVLAEMRRAAPSDFADKPEPSIESLGELPLVDAATSPPPSRPVGNPFPVFFINRLDEPVELFWMTTEGDRKSYGAIAPGQTKRQSTRPGAVWMVAGAGSKESLGHFVVDDRTARAVVRKASK